MPHTSKIFLAFLACASVSAFATQSVEESAPFALNLDGRESILEQASVDYVVWLGSFFDVEDLFDLSKVDQNADPDFDGESNLFEFWANSNPASREDDFRIELPVGLENTLRLGPLKTGVRFTLERSRDLQGWVEIDRGIIDESEEALFELSPGSDRAFIRLRLLKPFDTN